VTDTLTNPQRQFVVERLAAFDSATAVAKGLLEQFGVTVAPHVVAVYDPTAHAGRHCPRYWKRRFFEARQAITQKPPPEASRVMRLHLRRKMLRDALAREDFLLANRILDSIAKEVGDDGSLDKTPEITDEHRCHVLAQFIDKMRAKAQAARPESEEEARAWDRDPVAQFMAMYGPAPKKARGRKPKASAG
jgi:hypothetical protein